MLTVLKNDVYFVLLSSQTTVESRYTCIGPPGILGGCDPSAVVTAFLFFATVLHTIVSINPMAWKKRVHGKRYGAEQLLPTIRGAGLICKHRGSANADMQMPLRAVKSTPL